jgi:hypothetical protein
MNAAPPMPAVRAAARHLRSRGFALCKPDPREKKPTYPGWSARSLEAHDFADGDQPGSSAARCPAASAPVTRS